MAKDKKLVEGITSMDVDFAQWYTDVVKKAELCDYTSVKGCMVIKPAGFAIWENRKIWLKCGGFITIDRTEALTAIDVNTGKFVGKKDIEKTIYQVNKEATAELADFGIINNKIKLF